MKASELRIGNLVYYRVEDSYKKWLSMTEVVSQDLLVLSLNIRSHFEPIPITEEWLERFGFDYIKAGIHGKSGWLKKIQEDVFLFFNNHLQCAIFHKLYYIDMKIDHVHQLQNLFFALTGKELEIKK